MPGQIISISGVDGSGKSSIIGILQKRLQNKKIKTKYVWLRYNHYLTKFLLAFCRYAGFTEYKHFTNSRVVYHNFYRSKFISWLFIFLTFIDTFAASVCLVYIPLFFSKKIIICDRWVFDIMVDLEVDTHIGFTNHSLISKIFKMLIPKNCKYFLIFRNIDKVRNTKDESIRDKNFPVRYELYLSHSTDPLVRLINNDDTLENSVHQIINQL